MPSLTAFLDASVVLSGLASPHGGSGLLFVAAKKHKLTLVVTPLIINEVRRHLGKLNIDISQLELLLNQNVLLLIDNSAEKVIIKCCSLTTDPNDAHVLAGAIVSGAHYLISLDQKHIVTPKVKKYLLPIIVCSPRSFWQSLSS